MTLKRVKVSGKRIRAKLSIFDVELNDLPVSIAAFSRSFLLVKTILLGIDQKEDICFLTHL